MNQVFELKKKERRGDNTKKADACVRLGYGNITVYEKKMEKERMRRDGPEPVGTLMVEMLAG